MGHNCEMRGNNNYHDTENVPLPLMQKPREGDTILAPVEDPLVI